MVELGLVGLSIAGGAPALFVVVIALEVMLALANPVAGFPVLLVTSSLLIDSAVMACRRDDGG